MKASVKLIRQQFFAFCFNVISLVPMAGLWLAWILNWILSRSLYLLRSLYGVPARNTFKCDNHDYGNRVSSGKGERVLFENPVQKTSIPSYRLGMAIQYESVHTILSLQCNTEGYVVNGPSCWCCCWKQVLSWQIMITTDDDGPRAQAPKNITSQFNWISMIIKSRHRAENREHSRQNCEIGKKTMNLSSFSWLKIYSIQFLSTQK